MRTRRSESGTVEPTYENENDGTVPADRSREVMKHKGDRANFPVNPLIKYSFLSGARRVC